MGKSKERLERERREKLEKETKSKLRKRLFAAHVTNLKADTWCHYTNAAKEVFPDKPTTYAANMGSQLMKDKYVLNEIDRVVEAAGIGFADRVNALRDIIFGNITRESVTLVKDCDTKSWKEVQKHSAPPSFTERINAMKVLNQIDGTDKKANQMINHREKLLTEMRKKLTKDLIKARDETLRDVTDDLPDEAEKMQPGQSSSDSEDSKGGADI